MYERIESKKVVRNIGTVYKICCNLLKMCVELCDTPAIMSYAICTSDLRHISIRPVRS